MKVIFAGSRTIPPWVGDELAEMAGRIAHLRCWTITEIVYGGARGMDECGRRWAERHGVPFKKFAADWSQGKKAGLLRNIEMAEYADALIAVTAGTPGTRHMIQTARRRKLPMIVIATSGREWIAEAA